MVGTVPTEVKQLFSPHFFFNVTISQQVAVQFSPEDSKQLNHLTGKENA